MNLSKEQIIEAMKELWDMNPRPSNIDDKMIEWSEKRLSSPISTEESKKIEKTTLSKGHVNTEMVKLSDKVDEVIDQVNKLSDSLDKSAGL